MTAKPFLKTIGFIVFQVMVATLSIESQSNELEKSLLERRGILSFKAGH